MAPSFQDNLKAYKSLKLGPFEKKTDDVLVTARAFLAYFKQVESSMTALGITDADQKVKIFNLVEYQLSEKVNKIKDELVAAETDNWKKFTKKLKIYFQTSKLESAAQKRLKDIKQKVGQAAIDVQIEIEESWVEAGYAGDGEKDKHILQILLAALFDEEVRLQYQYSLMPGKTPLTIDQVIEVANVLALQKSKQRNHHSSNKVGFGSRGKFKSYPCGSCGSRRHQTGDGSCPAKGVECHGCHRIGHFKSKCRSPTTTSNSTSSSNRPGHSKQGNNHSKNFQNRKFKGKHFGRKKFSNNWRSKKATEEPEEQARGGHSCCSTSCGSARGTPGTAGSSNTQSYGCPPASFQSAQERQLAELLANSVHL